MGTRRSRRSFLAGGAAGAASALVLPRPLSALADAVERAPLASSPSDLRITGVRGGLIRNQHSLFVKVETNQGIYGCAEAVDGVYGAYYVMKHIAEQHLVGRSPLDVHRLQEDMRRGGVFKGAQAGMYVCVMTGLEQALWDLVGKALGLPVYRLLGGKFRDEIRVYCDTAGSRLEPAEMGRRAKEDVEKYGFTAVKFDIDDAEDPAKLDRYNWSVSPRELERMVAQIAAVREAVGPHVDVCVDCHGRFDEAAGHRIAKAMEPFGLLWRSPRTWSPRIWGRWPPPTSAPRSRTSSSSSGRSTSTRTRCSGRSCASRGRCSRRTATSRCGTPPASASTSTRTPCAGTR